MSLVGGGNNRAKQGQRLVLRPSRNGPGERLWFWRGGYKTNTRSVQTGEGVSCP